MSLRYAPLKLERIVMEVQTRQVEYYECLSNCAKVKNRMHAATFFFYKNDFPF